MVTLFSMRQMLAEAVAKEGYDFTFYKEAAVEKAGAFIQAGQEAMRNLMSQDTSGAAMSLLLSVELNAPLVIVPENIFNPSTACIAIDLGSVVGYSRVVEIDPDIDYRWITHLGMLFNCYTIAFEGFSLKVIERMQGSYRDILRLGSLAWDDTHALVKEFNFFLKVYDSVEKRNTLMPHFLLHLELKQLDLLFTDRMLQAIFKIRTALLMLLR